MPQVAPPSFAGIDCPSLMQPIAVAMAKGWVGLDLAPLPTSIPLQLLETCCPGHFMSPMALQLARLAQQPALELATALLPYVSEPERQVWCDEAGWLHVVVAQDAIATFLQSCTKRPPQLLSIPHGIERAVTHCSNLDDPDYFPMQYAHARCCSILRLAQQQQMIDLTINPATPPAQAFQVASPWPWLNTDTSLRLDQPMEQALIRQLLQFPGILRAPKRVWLTDATPQTVPVPWPLLRAHGVAQILGNSILKLEKECRFFELGHLERCQARLGLLLATQRVLAFALEDILQVVAPLEL